MKCIVKIADNSSIPAETNGYTQTKAFVGPNLTKNNHLGSYTIYAIDQGLYAR